MNPTVHRAAIMRPRVFVEYMSCSKLSPPARLGKSNGLERKNQMASDQVQRVIDDCPHDAHDVVTKRAAVVKQRQELVDQPTEWVTCSCGALVALRMAFRCWQCGIIFCSACAERHFGPKPKTSCVGEQKAEEQVQCVDCGAIVDISQVIWLDAEPHCRTCFSVND